MGGLVRLPGHTVIFSSCTRSMPLWLEAGATKAQIEEAMKGHVPHTRNGSGLTGGNKGPAEGNGLGDVHPARRSFSP